MDYGIFSLFPSLVAIVLAILTRQVMISLLAGVFIGKLILKNGSIFTALTDTLDAIIQVFSEGWTTKTNMYACIGAVISGGVMGDHCSPISDTTIVSSMAAACDHVDHVKTQIPYALGAGAIAAVLFLIAGYM